MAAYQSRVSYTPLLSWLKHKKFAKTVNLTDRKECSTYLENKETDKFYCYKIDGQSIK